MTLFPLQSRDYPGKRWVNITLRTLHLIGIAGGSAHFLLATSGDGWQVFFQLTLISGILLSLNYIWSNGIWLLQLRGQAILLKIVLLFAALGIWPEYAAGLFIVILVVSGLISHAPGDIRYYSPYHRKRIHQLPVEITRAKGDLI